MGCHRWRGTGPGTGTGSSDFNDKYSFSVRFLFLAFFGVFRASNAQLNGWFENRNAHPSIQASIINNQHPIDQ